MEKFIFVKAYVLASLKMWFALKYDPDQPRVPAGNETGGEWTSENVLANTKVVDENGNPKLVYHGTNNTFDKFDINRTGENADHPSANLGIFFADNKEEAQQYGKNIISAYLKMDNPYTMTAAEFAEELDFWRGVRGTDRYNTSRTHFFELTDYLISQGYDGIIIIGGDTTTYPELKFDNYIIFDTDNIITP